MGLMNLHYLCIGENRQFPSISYYSFSELSLLNFLGRLFFITGFIRPLTSLFRLWVKRKSLMFQYREQASVSNDRPVSTNDLPTQEFLFYNASKGYAGKKRLGLKKVNLN